VRYNMEHEVIGYLKPYEVYSGEFLREEVKRNE
jgi:hypothetical protein